MSRPIRLIVTDMDGTLLDPDKQITARTVEAVRAARKQGVAVTICSGRIHTMMENYLPALPVEGLYLAANGAVIADAGTGAIVWGAPIQENEVAALLDWAAARNYDVGVMAAGACRQPLRPRNSVRSPVSVRVVSSTEKKAVRSLNSVL